MSKSIKKRDTKLYFFIPLRLHLKSETRDFWSSKVVPPKTLVSNPPLYISPFPSRDPGGKVEGTVAKSLLCSKLLYKNIEVYRVVIIELCYNSSSHTETSHKLVSFSSGNHFLSSYLLQLLEVTSPTK